MSTKHFSNDEIESSWPINIRRFIDDIVAEEVEEIDEELEGSDNRDLYQSELVNV